MTIRNSQDLLAALSECKITDKGISFVESDFYSPNISSSVNEFLGEVPEAIYPEMHAITANWRTRNNTFYPLESLLGDRSQNTGYASAVFPYPIPVIGDHDTSKCEGTYGRVRRSDFIREGSGGWTRFIPEITHPEAIRRILSNEWMTLSIGVETQSVHCGVCGMDLMHSEGPACPHQKGQTYSVNGRDIVAYWEIGPITHQEISFVNVPSDVNARIKTPNVGAEGLRALARESNGSIVDLTSGRRVRTPQPKVWMHVQMKESFDKPLSQETTTSMSDVFLTMGALYSLDETDPDFSKEAKLTTKQRDDLPSTAFCGPDRSFPAHDRVHATQGLRMLGRYKGPGNKSAIRACLMRKLKSKKEAFEDIAILRNESLSIDTPILRAYVSESAPDFIARLESLNLPDAEPIKERYVRFASLNDVELPADLQSVSPSETADPVVINADEKNWPILYNFTEGVDEHSFDELLDVLLDTYDEEEVQEQESKEKEESETADLSKNEDFVAKSLLEESNSKVEALEAKIKDLEQAAPPAAPTGIYSKEDVDTLRKQILKMQGELHKNKAAEVARLKKIAGRKYAKDLTVEELTNAHLTRTVESLNDDLTELMSEIDFKHIVPVDYSSTNVPSPVVQLNNGPSNANTESPITPVVIDPLTGMPTIESSNITTEEDDTYTITLGLDPKVIARRSAEIAKSYSR